MKVQMLVGSLRLAAVTTALSLLLPLDARAACTVSGLAPTTTLPRVEEELHHRFSFVVSIDCVTLDFSVPGTPFSEYPTAGPIAGPSLRSYSVTLSNEEWSAVAGRGTGPTFTWTVTATDSAGATIEDSVTNELDSDHDGWTRTDGDIGACDHSNAMNPDLPETCDGVDNDCDGTIDDGVGTCATRSLALADAKLLGDPATSPGVGTGDRAGVGLAGVGDVDADGHDDILVGAAYESGDSNGAAFLFLGPVSGLHDLESADAKLVSDGVDPGFGYRVSAAGDADADGHDDLLIGSPQNNEGGTLTGTAYVLHGPVTGEVDLADADAKLLGEHSWDFAGIAVASAGDMNNDGYDDALVATEWIYSTGIVYVAFGPHTGTRSLALAGAKIVGAEGVLEAREVSGAGDVDGDGWNDVLIGVDHSYRLANSGAAFLIHGPVTGEVALSDADAKLFGEHADDEAVAVAGAGDVDDDGHADLLVGAPYNDDGHRDAGAAYVVLGPVSGHRRLATADAKLVGELASDWAGYSVSGAGDVDGDDRDDVIVGAYLHTWGDWGGPGRRAGAAYLIQGPVSGRVSLADADAKLTGEGRYDFAGRVVSGAGDVDADGRDDVLIGATGTNDHQGENAGAAYLWYGTRF